MAYRLGNNGHPEYSFEPETDLDQALHHFFMQLNTTAHVPYIEDMFKRIMASTLALPKEEERVASIATLHNKIMVVRYDKGLTTISYMMAKVWHDIMGWGGEGLLYHFIYYYGCWKDMKRFCLYAVAHGWEWSHPVIQYAIQMTNTQIRFDLQSSTPSFSAKWVPREKRQGAILFGLLAVHYFGEKKGVKREYRKIISLLTARLPLLEHALQRPLDELADDIKQMSSYGVFRQRAALFRRFGTSNIERSIQRMNVGSLVKAALHDPEDHAPLLNHVWKEKRRYKPTSKYIIPCVDLSVTDEDARCAAIGHGMEIAEASAFQRVLVFSAKGVAWIAIEGGTFVDKVKAMNEWTRAGDQDIYPVFEWLMQSIAESGLTQEEVEAMEVVILSDMQFIVPSSSQEQKIHEPVDKVLQRLYPILPKIVFSQVHTTEGCPCSQKK